MENRYYVLYYADRREIVELDHIPSGPDMLTYAGPFKTKHAAEKAAGISDNQANDLARRGFHFPRSR